MYSILIFLLTIALITVVATRYKTPPFLTLIGGALFFGLLSGMPVDTLVKEATAGMGRVFALLGLVILAGAVIAKVMQEQHQIEQLVEDIQAVVKKPFELSGVAGFLLAIPLMCCITAFVILTPVINALDTDSQKTKGLLYTAALGSLISFALIYPTPVIIALFSIIPGTAISPLLFDLFMLPIALVLLTGTIILMRQRYGKTVALDQKIPAPKQHVPSTQSHARAWYPFLMMGIAMGLGLAILGLSPGTLIQVVMLAGLVTALALAPGDVRKIAFTSGAKHAGVIIFDLCGAGALGAVIGASSLGAQAYSILTLALPALVVPFLLSALIQTAQGSRVVTAVITGQIIAGTGIAASIHPVPLILLISGGACIVSYMTDPYFWLVQRATGDDVGTVVRNYTIPLALFGIVLFVIAAGLEFFMV
ncbi:MAG: GntP family permease [Methanoregula sp.]|nr:GntP family permease [Methanoregula sp.]